MGTSCGKNCDVAEEHVSGVSLKSKATRKKTVNSRFSQKKISRPLDSCEYDEYSEHQYFGTSKDMDDRRGWSVDTGVFSQGTDASASFKRYDRRRKDTPSVEISTCKNTHCVSEIYKGKNCPSVVQEEAQEIYTTGDESVHECVSGKDLLLTPSASNEVEPWKALKDLRTERSPDATGNTSVHKVTVFSPDYNLKDGLWSSVKSAIDGGENKRDSVSIFSDNNTQHRNASFESVLKPSAPVVSNQPKKKISFSHEVYVKETKTT